MRRGDLDDLALFATVARRRSFTRAAAELGLSPSALSHALRGLERRLDIQLLARTTRSVAPTAAGEQLLRSLLPALDAVSRGVSALSDWGDVPSGTVRITSFGYATRTVLAPMLPGFLLRHPTICVEVINDDRPVDLIARGFDAGIRFGEIVERDMVAVRIGPDLRAVVVATPGYLAGNPQPTAPTDLHRHSCVNYWLPGANGPLSWDFERDGETARIRVGGQLLVNDETLAGDAVRAGVGLGYMMEHDVAGELADGRLVQILADWCPVFPGCFLYYPSRKTSAALRALIDALRIAEP